MPKYQIKILLPTFIFKFMNYVTFFLDYKKISSLNVNKLLKQHLKQFDENESQLKRVSDF